MKLKHMISTVLAIAIAGYTCGLGGQNADDLIICSTVQTPKATIEYICSRSDILDPKNHWDPAKGPFPFDIAAGAKVAEENVRKTRDINMPLELRRVLIFRDPMARRLEGGRVNASDVWFLHYAFAQKSPVSPKIDDSELVAIILLNGTVANPKLAAGEVTVPFRK